MIFFYIIHGKFRIGDTEQIDKGFPFSCDKHYLVGSVAYREYLNMNIVCVTHVTVHYADKSILDKKVEY